ncbi:hypothetical protein [Candidatus Bandiella euplotis]|uniref:Transposase n=1 Tax=Candidatus Bandiella euplotis TaxID=1664265 RepID=A0ABZ0ULB2_9RICK|nr:hypothetical protein [Candidatus Bandiella woodruffii]WPX96924.1 hypothetical protein Bandiella_01060 [Candidatus Bandiella woodruffii]
MKDISSEIYKRLEKLEVENEELKAENKALRRPLRNIYTSLI